MLNTMLTNRQVTQQGVDWLTVATDPFHDTEISPPGFPDADCSRSIPQMYQFTGTLSAPVTLPTPTWDAHVTFCPTSYAYGGIPGISSPLTRTSLSTAGVVVSTSNSYGFQGGYNAIGVAAGINVITAGTVGVASGIQNISYPAAASSGQFRLVAAGCEVVNTTPELYRGGSVTNYRSASIQRPGVFDAPGPTPNNPCTFISLPPGSVTEAQLYPTSRTWGAEEGTYLVATLDSSSNDYSSATPNHVIAVNPFDTSTLVAGGSTTAFMTTATYNGIPSNCSTALPYDWHGAIFTGLAPQTTLQVTVRYYVERIPTITQPELLVLTRIPAPYDPVCLEIYSRCMSELPVAVRVCENPLGEWFNEIMDMVGTWAPRIGAGLSTFIPGGAAIGNAVGLGAKSLGNLNRGNTKKKDNSVTNKNTMPPAYMAAFAKAIEYNRKHQTATATPVKNRRTAAKKKKRQARRGRRPTITDL